MQSRPAGVTVVCIFAIALGALGVLTSLTHAATLAVGPDRLREMMPTPHGGEEVARLQNEMQAEQLAISDPWKPLTYSLLVLELIASGGLIVGGAMTLKLAESGRKLLRGVLACVMPLEIVRSAFQIYISIQMSKVMGTYFVLISEAQSKGGRMQVGMGDNFARATMIAGVAIAVIWLLVTLAFYFTSWLYLNRPAVRAAFALQTDEELA